jgi:hypothetical protein
LKKYVRGPGQLFINIAEQGYQSNNINVKLLVKGLPAGAFGGPGYRAGIPVNVICFTLLRPWRIRKSKRIGENHV